MMQLIDIMISFIESLLMSYFCIRYFNIEYKKIRILACMTVLLTIIVTISNYFESYDVWLPFIDILVITVLLYYFEKKHTIYEKIFVSILLLLLIQIACNVAIFLVSMLFHIPVQYATSYSFESFIASAIISRFLLCIFILYISKLKSNFTIRIDNHIWRILISISGVVTICENYLGELLYTRKIDYFNLYLVMFGFGLMSITIIYLFFKMKKDAEEKMLREIELSQLKQIEKQYIELTVLKERNDKIKHDLKYFLAIVSRHKNNQDLEELPKLLNQTIATIDENILYVYSKDKVFNSILNFMKQLAQSQNKKIHYSITDSDIALPVDLYEVLMNMATEIINISTSIRFSLHQTGGYHVFDFYYETCGKYVCDKGEKDKIVDKYDGMVLQDNEDNVQQISVYMKL